MILDRISLVAAAALLAASPALAETAPKKNVSISTQDGAAALPTLGVPATNMAIGLFAGLVALGIVAGDDSGSSSSTTTTATSTTN